MPGLLTMASNTTVISNSPVNEPICVDLLINEVDENLGLASGYSLNLGQRTYRLLINPRANRLKVFYENKVLIMTD